MLKELKTLFAQQAEQELLQTTRDFHFCRQEEGQSVSSYVLKMKGYIDNLERLGHPVTLGLGVSLILIGLRKKYNGFVQNYNMHSMGKTVNELHAMLKLHEQTLPKSNALALNAIRAGKFQKAELMKKKKNTASGTGGLGIFVIELNTILNRSWICDTGCGTHICNTTQGLRASRKLKPGALSLYVGNGQREAVEATGAFYLCLPNGLEIVLNNCHYAPSITIGVISVSRLYEDGFVNRFVDNTIQVFRYNVVYFSAILRDGIFEIDLSNSLTNKSSIYAVSNKKVKLDLDSALLWHCRLGHISKKRIKKLQHDGLFDSSALRAFEKCVSCMSGKMARKPYTHQVERAKDILGLIHTDVCAPFKIMSRQGSRYFVTFTDDFSCYGYVYLLKHKHDVFETFKVFQKEVENQLGKTIKSLRSDCGGEYMSQEFLDHLKDHGIIAHRTPPYTPQHNEIDEPQSDIVPIRRSTRTRHAPDRMCLYIDAEEHELKDLCEPANYKSALLDQESKKWLNAMNVEMQSIKDNEVWVLVELPPNGKIIGIADIRAIRILIAIAAYYDYEIWQMDVKIVFLNGYLNEENSKRGSILMQEKLKLSKLQGASTPAEMKRMQNVLYASAIGSIMYAVRCTRSDVAFAQNVTSRFQQNPGDILWTTVKNIMKYLGNTKDMFLVYGGDLKRELRVSCNTDAGYLTDADDLKSQTGYVFVLNGGAVDWKSAKQSIFATSFAEAEYITAFDASKEVVWVRKFISGLGVVPSIEEPINMYCDNT
uniref:Integrase catalytic domain-containing protein n=1 Tax=Tanacetum cinerariifolium TaxID=118510 RepID=A0A6L2NSP5_TANCI|nr:hypothetical protein [Tanacetum cinerariifolium]